MTRSKMDWENDHLINNSGNNSRPRRSNWSPLKGLWWTRHDINFNSAAAPSVDRRKTLLERTKTLSLNLSTDEVLPLFGTAVPSWVAGKNRCRQIASHRSRSSGRRLRSYWQKIRQVQKMDQWGNWNQKRGHNNMNRDEGQCFLTHVFDELLEKSPGKNQLVTW